jgi:hypothetical protein
MKRRSHARVNAAKPVHRASAGGPYVFFCGSIVITVGALMVTSLLLPPRKMPWSDVQRPQIPVAKIELDPDRKGECRHILFHNDSGSFEEGRTGRCSGLNSDIDGQAAARRAEALKRAFNFRNN